MISRARYLRQLYPFREPSTSIDHLVIGGGAVGLSVAAGLVNTSGRDKTTFLVERRGQLGQETTARNSEVIHSGIYYPLGSLKSKLCIRGRDLLYERCKRLGIEHKNTGKIVVATSQSQIPYLEKLQRHSQHPSFLRSPDDPSSSSIFTRLLSGEEARELEPDLSDRVCRALMIPSTGIVDSQGLVDSLSREIEEPEYNQGASSGATSEDRGEGVIVLGTRVVRIDKEQKGDGWVVQLETNWEGLEEGQKGDVESVRADVVVNAAGLGAVSLTEGVHVEGHSEDRDTVKMYAVKGNYMSYKGPGVGSVSRLIYPCPSANIDHLGTHLTLDLNGNIKFGPDVQPIGSTNESSSNPEFWEKHLSPSDSPDLIRQFSESVLDYLPSINPDNLQPDYAGIRPNIAPPGSGFSDFLIRHNYNHNHDSSGGRKGFIELLGFNSPGLTSSLAVGEYVSDLVAREIRGKYSKIGKGRERRLEHLAKGWEG
uniref:L-2-hydroxyglutarate dehydrogenase, mitochondrial n=1 Tax=Kwoniella dejecticola CBS 10117 TaxID=1296121 RepID=A0A1A5ZVQ0_9TREE|nr:FAD dependent oxidoreductase [Kwoniella dejecticola CBS 10117]OBR81888.1 FAD dependent oxidoreductase [Kwoniella dejecticola CBS 10117]